MIFTVFPFLAFFALALPLAETEAYRLLLDFHFTEVLIPPVALAFDTDLLDIRVILRFLPLEATWLFTQIGLFELGDIFHNTLGVVIGWLLWKYCGWL